MISKIKFAKSYSNLFSCDLFLSWVIIKHYIHFHTLNTAVVHNQPIGLLRVQRA